MRSFASLLLTAACLLLMTFAAPDIAAQDTRGIFIADAAQSAVNFFQIGNLRRIGRLTGGVGAPARVIDFALNLQKTQNIT